MSNERAATHAPKTELPTMREGHAFLIRYFQSLGDRGKEADRALEEIRVNIEAQVSGEAKLVPTAEIRELHEMTINPPNDSRVVVRAHYATSRWLTPEDER